MTVISIPQYCLQIKLIVDLLSKHLTTQISQMSLITLTTPSASSSDGMATVNAEGQVTGSNETVDMTLYFGRHGPMVIGLFLAMVFIGIVSPMPQITFYGSNPDGSINLDIPVIPPSMRPLAATNVDVTVVDVTRSTSTAGVFVFNPNGSVTLTFNSTLLDMQIGDELTIQNVPISWITSV